MKIPKKLTSSIYWIQTKKPTIKSVIIVYLFVSFVIVALFSFPTPIIESATDESIQSLQEISIPATEPFQIGGGRSDVYFNQKLQVTFDSSIPLNISLIQKNNLADPISYFRLENVNHLERMVDITKHGRLSFEIENNSEQSGEFTISISRSGLPGPFAEALIFILVMISISIIVERYFIPIIFPRDIQGRINQSIEGLFNENHLEDNLYLADPTKLVSPLRQFILISKEKQNSFLLIAFLYPIVMLLLERQIGEFTSFIPMTDQNKESIFEKMSNTELQMTFFYLLFVNRLIFFFSFATPILLFNYTTSIRKNSNMHSNIYPVDTRVHHFSQSIVTTFYISLIPLLDVMLRLYFTYRLETVQFDTSSIFVGFSVAVLTVFTIVSLYYFFYNIIDNFLVRLILPIFVILISNQSLFISTDVIFFEIIHFGSIYQIYLISAFLIFLSALSTLLSIKVQNAGLSLKI